MKNVPDRIWEKFISRMKQVKDSVGVYPDKILVSVSGGPDSMFLLFLILNYARKHNVSILPVYINHQVRTEPEIKKDIATIEHFCKKNGLSLLKESLPENIRKDENTLRNYRYQLLLNIAKKYKYNFIAVGHTKDDVVETVLLNLFRGTGINGLKGIPFIRDLTPEEKNKKIFIFRPLIDIQKNEIIKILSENKINFVVDKTNLQSNYNRNLIRNKIIPLINNINRNFKTNIIKTVDLFNQLQEYIEPVVKIALKNIVLKETSSYLSIDFRKFLMYNLYIQQEILHQILDKIAKKKDIKFTSGYKPIIDKIIQFLTGEKVFSELKQNLKIKKYRNKLYFYY